VRTLSNKNRFPALQNGYEAISSVFTINVINYVKMLSRTLPQQMIVTLIKIKNVLSTFYKTVRFFISTATQKNI
jgi:hypothetical protein